MNSVWYNHVEYCIDCLTCTVSFYLQTLLTHFALIPEKAKSMDIPFLKNSNESDFT